MVLYYTSSKMMRRLLLLLILLPFISAVSGAFVLPSSTTSSSTGRRQISSATPTNTASKIIIPTKRQKQQETVITTAVSSSSSTSSYHPHFTTTTTTTTRLSLANNNNDNDNSNESSTPSINFSKKSIPQLIGTIFLIVLTFGSITNLFTRELPMVFTGDPKADYFGAVFDTLFVGWATQTLWLQTGAIADSPITTATTDDDNNGEKSTTSNRNIIDLDGLECRINVDVGRESGTWMDKDWAASGGRLVLPIKVKFTNEQIDLGIPGEEGLGGRYCRRLQVLDDQEISFVGQQGQVTVNVQDGGWATLPILNQKLDAGERKLRFFLDFPQGAQRNDVTIPQGRVFFSSACLPPSSSLGNDSSSSSSSIVSTSLIKAPSGDGIFKEGGITIKSNGGILNLWGAAGDINLILGRYSVSELS